MAVGESSPNSFEAAAAASPQTVAQFEVEKTSLLHKIQHWLHLTPSAVTMIVLLLLSIWLLHLCWRFLRLFARRWRGFWQRDAVKAAS